MDDDAPVAVSGTRRAMKELMDGTIRVSIDIDPKFRRAFMQLFPEIDTGVVLAPLARNVTVENQVPEAAKEPAKKVPATVEKEPAKQAAIDKPRKRGGFADNVGPLARLAVQWCEDTKFQDWLAGQFMDEWMYLDGAPGNDRAKTIICSQCQVMSRKELDESPDSAAEFNRLFRIPYMKFLEERGA